VPQFVGPKTACLDDRIIVLAVIMLLIN